MSCFRCGNEFVPTAERTIELIQLDEGAAHPLCCTKEELAALLKSECLSHERTRKSLFELYDLDMALDRRITEAKAKLAEIKREVHPWAD